MAAYYNENEPYAAQWLKNLIAQGLIADGDVDTRSIVDVRSNDLAGYEQCHFFAGIGGWSCALRLAGWPDDRHVWTGSCPCQPFSLAGKRNGFADERHLWPIWRELIRERHPSIVLGEQVASATAWLRLVRSDLETMGYAVGAIPIEAASAGADHLRDRYWFLGDAVGSGLAFGSIAEDWRGDIRHKGPSSATTGDRGSTMVNTRGQSGRLPEHAGWAQDSEIIRTSKNVDWFIGADGKARRAKSGVRLLAHGIPNRVAKLRAFGNAIVPQAAAQFIRAIMEPVIEGG